MFGPVFRGGGGVFCGGGLLPPRPPKCAHSGAFHEVVRLGGAKVAWGGKFGVFLSCLPGFEMGWGCSFRVWTGELWGWE